MSLTTTFVFPRGLWYADNSGNIGNHSVKVVLEYSMDNVNWYRMGSDTIVPQEWYVVFHDLDYGDIIEKRTGYHGSYITTVAKLPSGVIRYNTTYWEEWYYTPSYTVPYVTITDASTSTIRKTFKAKYLTKAKYYVRARFYEAPTSGTRYGSDCYLEYITEEIGDDFTYPNTALISVRALATDQLSGGNP